MTEKIQTITFLLSDGSKAYFSGKAVFDTQKSLDNIVKILVSEPKELPKNYSFEDIIYD